MTKQNEEHIFEIVDKQRGYDWRTAQRNSDEKRHKEIVERDYIKKDECNKLIEKELDYIIELTETIHRDYISKQSIRDRKPAFLEYIEPHLKQMSAYCVEEVTSKSINLLTGDNK